MRARLATPLLVGLSFVAACSGDGKELVPPDDPLPPGEILDTTSATDEPVSPAPSAAPSPSAPDEPLQLLAAWPDAGALPERHTCADVGVSPALAWTVTPAATAEVAISAVDVTDERRVLWLVEAIDPRVGSVEEGSVPADAVVRINDAGTAAWDPPCPPVGERRDLVITVYALDRQVELPPDVAAADVVAAYESAALDRAAITASVQLGS